MVSFPAGLLAVLLACGAPPPDYPVTQQSRLMTELNARARGSAPPVVAALTGERIRRAREEPHNWLTYYGAYDAQRYSGLRQITAGNAGDLRVAWVFQSNVYGLKAAPATFAYEAAPIVVDGVLFSTGPDGYVWALDAATGEQLWTYRHAIPLDVPLCCGNVNRGVAVAAGKIYFATANGYLVALDAESGRALWQRAFADMRAGESATVAPIVVKDLVIVGSSGGEYGVRGHIDAFDLETGERRWRRYNVPKPGEPGSETWPDAGDAWARGGGTSWITGSYDPDLDLVYWGTGNPGPVLDGSGREGDNLYTSSVVAFDPDDGQLRWHYQWTPHDVWDYDGVNENILFERDGRRLLAHFDKNGHLFVLDRADGSLVRATPFARVTWGEIHPTTGAVTVHRVPTREGTDICPGPAGAKEWPHAAYSPRTGLLYAPIVELCANFRSQPEEFNEGMPFFGSEVQTAVGEQWGEIKAMDPLSGEVAWVHRTEHPVVASVLATAGDVVFAGLATGEFQAFDARSGRLLWSFQTGNGIHSSPVTYSVAGKQYVAVWSGWGGWLEGFAPELYGAPRGGALFVFALP